MLNICTRAAGSVDLVFREMFTKVCRQITAEAGLPQNMLSNILHTDASEEIYDRPKAVLVTSMNDIVRFIHYMDRSVETELEGLWTARAGKRRPPALAI